MTTLGKEVVTDVCHWNDALFSVRTTRATSFRFESGQFLMLGLPVNGKPLLRAYSIASAHYDDHLEFFSIKVPNGPLTSKLQHVTPGQELLVSRKPTGTLLLHDLLPGRRVFLLGTGTGLAPFLSLVRDPEIYARFERIVLVHGVRRRSDLAYRDFLSTALQQDEFLGEKVRRQLLYYPTVTREPFHNRGRLTQLLASGRWLHELGEPPIDAAVDRAMICGSPQVLADLSALLDAQGFNISRHIGDPGHYVIERAFVEKDSA